jgi:hypothetical protein
MRWLSLRALFLLGFAVGMPVLALPPVARWIDDLLYGPPPADFGLPPSDGDVAARAEDAVATPATPPGPAQTSSPSTISSLYSLPEEGGSVVKAQDSPATWPQLPQTPDFSPIAHGPDFPPSVPQDAPAAGAELAPMPVNRIDEQTIARLQAIRQRLETLGADYVLVETLADGSRFRFHCRMRVDAESPYTRPFEARSFDPVAAGEEVLQQVEQWRQVRSSTDRVELPRR